MSINVEFVDDDSDLDLTDEAPERFKYPYDEVFLPDGSRLEPTSVLEDP
jgi:hypothetical protein